MSKRLAFALALAVAAGAPFGTASAQEAAGSGGAAPAFSPVTWERLLTAADEPHNWLM